MQAWFWLDIGTSVEGWLDKAILFWEGHMAGKYSKKQSKLGEL
jgi:hypothetical protein